MYLATAFALFCLVCTVFAFTRHPIYGLYFYLATTFVFPPGRWWGGYLPDLRWALLSAAITALAVAFHRGKLQPKPLWIGNAPAVLLTLYATWMLLQTPWALDVKEHLDGWLKFVKCILALWFVYRVIDSKDRLRDVMLAHVLGLPMPNSSSRFTMLASVKRAGGEVAWPLGVMDATATSWPTTSAGNKASLSSSVAASSSLDST